MHSQAKTEDRPTTAWVGVQVNLPHTLLQPQLVDSGPTHAQKANGAAAAGLFFLHTVLLKNQI